MPSPALPVQHSRHQQGSGPLRASKSGEPDSRWIHGQAEARPNRPQSVKTGRVRDLTGFVGHPAAGAGAASEIGEYRTIDYSSSPAKRGSTGENASECSSSKRHKSTLISAFDAGTTTIATSVEDASPRQGPGSSAYSPPSSDRRMNNVHEIDKRVRQARVQSHHSTEPLFTDCPMSSRMPSEKAVAQLPDHRRQSDLPPYDGLLRQRLAVTVSRPPFAEQFPPTACSKSGAGLPDTDKTSDQGFPSTDPGARDETELARDVDEVQLALGEMASGEEAEDAEGNDGVVLKNGCTCGGCYISVDHDQYEYQTMEEWMTEGTGYMTKLQEITQKYMELSIKRAKAFEEVLARIEQQRQAVMEESTACTKRAQDVERDVSMKLGLRGPN